MLSTPSDGDIVPYNGGLPYSKPLGASDLRLSLIPLVPYSPHTVP